MKSSQRNELSITHQKRRQGVQPRWPRYSSPTNQAEVVRIRQRHIIWRDCQVSWASLGAWSHKGSVNTVTRSQISRGLAAPDPRAGVTCTQAIDASCHASQSWPMAGGLKARRQTLGYDFVQSIDNVLSEEKNLACFKLSLKRI